MRNNGEIISVLKDISNKIGKLLTKSMSKEEQRKWWKYSIIFTIIMGLITAVSISVIGAAIYSLFHQGPQQKDYDILVKTSDVKLNTKNNVNFEFNFTNIGRKNIQNLDVFEIDLYRLEKNEFTYYRTAYTHDPGKETLNCIKSTDYSYVIENFLVGDTCTLKFSLFSCPECFDDKEKITQMYIYLKSVPPIENKVVNLTIY